MIWRRISDYSLQSADGVFLVTRYGMGDALAYQAISTRSGGKSLHIERVAEDDDDARREAVRRCQQACEKANGN